MKINFKGIIYILTLFFAVFISSCKKTSTTKNTKQITSFIFKATDNGLSADAVGVIDESNKTITLRVPIGAKGALLSPTIIHNGKKVTPASGAVQDFTSKLYYLVVDESGNTATYEVTVFLVSMAKEITRFEFTRALNPGLNKDYVGVIDFLNITFEVPQGTDVTKLKPTIAFSDGATISSSKKSGDENDFSSPQIYTVQAKDNSTQNYTVKVTIGATILEKAKEITRFDFTVAKNTGLDKDYVGRIDKLKITFDKMSFATDITKLKPTIVVSAGATISSSKKSEDENDFSSPQTYTIKAEDNSTQDYTITVTKVTAQEAAKEITRFDFTVAKNSGLDRDYVGRIDKLNITFDKMPNATDITKLKPTIVVSTGATISSSKKNEDENDFSSPQTYTVKAQDNSTQSYKITVTKATALEAAKEITRFVFAKNKNTGLDKDYVGRVSNEFNITFDLLPYGTDLTKLIPTIEFSAGARISSTKKSEEENDFSTTQPYTVQAQDNSTQVYIVTVTRVVAGITSFTFTKALNTGLDKDYAGRIDNLNITFDKLPPSANIAALKPTIGLSTGAMISSTKKNEDENNFKSTQTYSVSSQSRYSQDYKVTVTKILSSEAKMSVFKLIDIEYTINQTTGIIKIKNGGPGLQPHVEISKFATLEPLVPGGAKGTNEYWNQDFSKDVKYKVIAEDGTEKVYTITIASSEAKILTFSLSGNDGYIDEATGTIRVAEFTGDKTMLQAAIAISDKSMLTPNGPQDYSHPVKFTVTAYDEVTTKEYTVTVGSPQITDFKFKGYTGSNLSWKTTITQNMFYEKGKILVNLYLSGLDISAWPTDRLLIVTNPPNSTVEPSMADFSNGKEVEFTITAPSGAKKVYIVTAIKSNN